MLIIYFNMKSLCPLWDLTSSLFNFSWIHFHCNIFVWYFFFYTFCKAFQTECSHFGELSPISLTCLGCSKVHEYQERGSNMENKKRKRKQHLFNTIKYLYNKSICFLILTNTNFLQSIQILSNHMDRVPDLFRRELILYLYFL